MQLKIIRIRGQCRGHPPTRGAPRDELGAVVSRQSSVKPPGHLVHLSDLSALVVKRKRRETVISHWSLVVGQVNLYRPPTADRRPLTADQELFKFRSSLARDWVNHTCSVKPDIKKNRHKHRWRATCQPAGKWRDGRIMPYYERKRNLINIYLS
jgi:hypothetical protein